MPTAWNLPIAWSLLPQDVGSARMETMLPWHILVLALVSIVILALIVWMYMKDSVELRPGTTATLLLLRICAFAALLIFFFNLEKRTIMQRVSTSRVYVLIDTSQSMSEPAADSSSTPSGKSRIERVAEELSRGDLIENLRKKHDVVAYAFDEQQIPREIAAFSKITNTANTDSNTTTSRQTSAEQHGKLTRSAVISAAIFAVSLALGALFLILRGSRFAAPHASWALFSSVVFLIVSFVWLGVGCLNNSEATAQLLGISDKRPTEKKKKPKEEAPEEDDVEQNAQDINWLAKLPPKGERTQLNEALRNLVSMAIRDDKEGKCTLAAIVVFSDGCDNTDTKPLVPIAAANEGDIKIYLVGMGTTQRPTNVAVVDLQAPPRVLPGDDFTIIGLLRAYNMAGREVKVELVSAPLQGNQQGTFVTEREERVRLTADGEEVSVKFQITPGNIGRRIFKLRVIPSENDHNPRDNEESTVVEIVDRKNRVMLIAGGPTREYRFLRNMLHRDDDTTVDVLLQTGQPGISQEADNLLLDFPKTSKELFEYDCIVAFDPDWQKFDEVQVELLERWVSEVAGGLIVVAGPVHTPQWSNRRLLNDRLKTIQGLYPVRLYSQGAATIRLGRFGGEEPFPLDFTRDGRESEFLWLDETALESEKNWSEFEGVYGYYAVKDPKPGAQIYARFSDPDTAIEKELPIYLAGHFYGAGRVFFQASGEMWRVRSVDVKFFEQYYTKLIRWVSQGRLLRDSSRGVLLVDKERCMPGDRVGVRAILTDAQHRPLTQKEITVMLISDRTRKRLNLQKLKSGSREGVYAGQFTAVRPGKHTVQLRISTEGEDILLTRDVRVESQQLEVRNPQRRDNLMGLIANKTGGKYFVGIDVAMSRGRANTAPIYSMIDARDQKDQTQDKFPDSKFQKVLMTWLLSLLCGALCLEWITRRLSKLA